MSGRPARPTGRTTQTGPAGQHFLRGPYAAELVRLAQPSPGELLVDLGAGAGSVTRHLAASGARVIAVESDQALARRLRRRFADHPRVTVVAADIRTVPWPRRPFRIVANPPFGCTSALLQRMIHPPGDWLTDAHLVLQRGAALGLLHPHRAMTRRWAARWQVQIVRGLPPTCFVPPPSVDGVIVVVRRRP